MSNPFAELSASISPGVMQAYVILMILFVIGGTLFDVIHKGSAKYFFDNMRRGKSSSKREVSGGEKAGIIAKTVAHDVLASGEFCTTNRRISHLLGMYGFILFVLATAVMIFSYPTAVDTTPAIWPLMWHLGALMVTGGGLWFWLFIRVDVAAEGSSPLQIMKADLFVLSLVATTTAGLLWSIFQGTGFFGGLFFVLFVLASTVLFGGVYWSKFAHMFFKPAAAIEKHLAEADGSMNNLPPPADAPAKFGLGIKRESPSHY